MEKHKRNSFSGSLGFVLAAAGSAVGLGNIWRFPYLAAKDGGGLFLVTYLILAVTFGFALLTTEVVIGRKTKQSPLTAYGKLCKKYKPLGIVACLVPTIILPYYCAIGGWVIKYFLVFLTDEVAASTADDYFTGFITGNTQPIIYMLIFLAVVAFVVFRGVNKGIEATSRVLMPILIILIVGISLFALTISHTDDNGVTRTGLDGFRIYVIPDFANMSLNKFVSILMDAMGQLFFSLSVAMGIMIAYGSYMKDDVNLVKSINQIEIFDTLVAFLAGVMVIPSVFVYMGREGMEASGPGLMFVSFPKVFDAMGSIGRFVGCVFFAMVFFAAITSAISIMEAVVSSFMDQFRFSRFKASAVETVITAIGAVIVCLGYNKFYFELKLPNGTTGQILDVMDYVSNNFLMPIVSIGTCILVGWVLKPKTVIDEVEKNGVKFGRRTLYIVMIKYIAPILLILLFFKSIGIFNLLGIEALA